VRQAADELPPLGGGRRGSGTRGHGPRPLNSHVKDITLKIGSPSELQLGEVWGQQLIPKLPALTLLRYPARVQLMSAKEIGQRAQADPRRVKCLIWQKRYIGGSCKTLRSRTIAACLPRSESFLIIFVGVLHSPHRRCAFRIVSTALVYSQCHVVPLYPLRGRRERVEIGP
jgi:hypothetical protein